MKLSASWLIKIKAVYIPLKHAVLKVISLSSWFSSIYYGLCSPSFRREQRAVVSGLKRHMELIRNDASFFLLRRNAHRLEKGLVMPKRKPIFALEYIGETVTYYENCLRSGAAVCDREEFKWAGDILKLYFASVASNPIIERARRKFFGIVDEQTVGQRVPYLRGTGESPVSTEDLLALAKRRKSVRVFLQKPVPHALLDEALKIAALAPSSCNRQPVHYRFYDQPELLRELAAMPLGTAGFADNIPMICVLTGDLSAYFYERDRHSIYVDGCLSAMLFMLALESVGLASCPLNWPEIDRLDSKLETLIKLPAYERAILFMAVGYADPDGLVACSQKKDLSELRSYNRVG
ncbi:MAG: nitroreductase family protein [Deltaproteobacteria bacterium]|nr:nitroreductase family protein [Deltaproteobacteria bacterium]